jgi:plastocyanin
MGGIAAAGALLPATARAGEGTLKGQAIVKRGKRPRKDASGVVVRLDGIPGSPARAANQVHEIRQLQRRFVPESSAVLVGTTVSFPNDDRVFHNVFSTSEAASFDLGLYKSGTTKMVRMQRPGVVEVYCNIHPDMAARVLVLDTRWFTTTAADGTFSIPSVPVGTWRWTAWHARCEPVRGETTVVDGAVSQIHPTLIEGRWPPHPQKDGTPYGRYQ